MKKLVKPATPPEFIEHLISIREAKVVAPGGIDHKAVLTSRHDQIAMCFNVFETAIETGGLHQMTPSAALSPIADSLRSCYASTTIGIRRVKELVANAQPRRVLKYCPMCGTTLPRTHDHYLPASKFPEFSVHALNLVPCCAQCNSIKDNGWLDAAGKRQYLHLFSDEIPAHNFLVVTLKELSGSRGVGALFQLKRPADVLESEWELIELHYRRLHLLERYDDQAGDEIGEILADCEIYLQEAGETDASSFLSRRAAERAAVYGSSHWRVVLMQALSVSPKLSVWISAISPSSTLALLNET
jgi:hypothetical protein